MTHTPPPEKVKRIGMVARWQPVHNGHLAVLQGLCDTAETAFIGIGSSNEVDYRNPFPLEHREAMLNLVLPEYDNYQLLPIPDLHNGPRWRQLIIDTFGELDIFVTANPYVKSLLENDYTIQYPITFVPENKRVPVNGTMVRERMAQGEDWQSLVPAPIASYFTEHKLDTYFKQKYGLQTLAIKTMIQEKEGD